MMLTADWRERLNIRPRGKEVYAMLQPKVNLWSHDGDVVEERMKTKPDVDQKTPPWLGDQTRLSVE